MDRALRDLPIVMISMSRWDDHLSSAAFSLAKELARHNRVYYFDYPYTITEYWGKRKSDPLQRRKAALLQQRDIAHRVEGTPDNFFAVTPPLMLPFFPLPEGKLFKGVVALNNQRLFKSLRRLLKQEGVDEFIFFNSFNPFYGQSIPADLGLRFHIYQSRDNLRGISTMPAQAVAYEARAAAAADLVIATSGHLCEVVSGASGTTVHHLPNAAELKIFSKVLQERYERPAGFPDNGKPVVGFIGNIGPRMDVPLVVHCLNAHRDKDFVMLGPNNLSEEQQRLLQGQENLYILDPQALPDLPPYLQFMDVTMIPFEKTELTRSIYPLKLNEQLAAGKAIVTTDFSEDVKSFADVVYIAGSAEQFAVKIGEALGDQSAAVIEKRRKRAAGNSWENRVEQLWQLVEETSNSEQS